MRSKTLNSNAKSWPSTNSFDPASLFRQGSGSCESCLSGPVSHSVIRNLSAEIESSFMGRVRESNSGFVGIEAECQFFLGAAIGRDIQGEPAAD